MSGRFNKIIQQFYIKDKNKYDTNGRQINQDAQKKIDTIYYLGQWLGFDSFGIGNGIIHLDVLPTNAKNYLQQIENMLEIPIHSVGVGPDRDATIHLF